MRSEYLIDKNIIDLEYQRLLSYFEIVSISIISAIIGLAVAYLTQQITFGLFIYSVTFSAALFALLNGLILRTLNKKKIQLLKLKI